MGGANEYLLQNKELNYVSKGFLWGLWNLLPIAGSIIVTIKILNRIFRSTSRKVLMFIALIIPVVNIGAAIYFLVLVFERIGGKFLIGVLIVPVLLGIFTTKCVPIYTGFVERARVVEATAIMGAIITSQKNERCRTKNFYNGGPANNAFVERGLDISDTRFFVYETAADTGPPWGFTVTATATDDFGAAGGWMRYTYGTTATPTESWTCDGSIILPDMLPTPPLLSVILADNTFTAKVVRVSDGDIISVMRQGRAVKARLHGIDCPEKKQPYGTKAKQYTSEMAFGKEVTVRIKDTDRYGRIVGEVIIPDGISLNKELVFVGLAWWYRKYAPNDQELMALEAVARAEKKGLWADPDPIPPWEWRRQK